MDLKITSLTADTTPTSDDLIVTVNDPAGTPANKKVTLADAVTKAHGLSDSTTIGVVSGVIATRTGTQVTASLDNFTGDSGAGGVKGLVPAPAAGDAAAGKFLKADGNWTAPSGSGDVTGPGSSVDNALVRFNGTTGKVIQDYTSGAPTVGDTGAMVVPVSLTLGDGSGASYTLASNLSGATDPSIIFNDNEVVIATLCKVQTGGTIIDLNSSNIIIDGGTSATTGITITKSHSGAGTGITSSYTTSVATNSVVEGITSTINKRGGAASAIATGVSGYATFVTAGGAGTQGVAAGVYGTGTRGGSSGVTITDFFGVYGVELSGTATRNYGIGSTGAILIADGTTSADGLQFTSAVGVAADAYIYRSTANKINIGPNSDIGVATGTSLTTNSVTVHSANGFSANAGNTTGYAFSSTTNASWTSGNVFDGNTSTSVFTGSVFRGITNSVTTGAVFTGSSSSNSYTGTGLLKITYSGTGSGDTALITSTSGTSSGNALVVNQSGSGLALKVTGVSTFTDSITTGAAGVATGQVKISGTTSGTATITVPAVAGTPTYVLPAAVGGAGTFLKDAAGDGVLSWATPAGSGDVTKVGTPVNNQVGVWTGDGTLEGDTALTFDTTTDTLASGIVTVTDDPYGAGWNGSTAVPTKNAIYDKIETLGGGGNVSNTGTPVDNQIAIWTAATTIEGDAALTFDTATDTLSVGTTGVVVSGTIELGHATDTTLARVSAGVVSIEGNNIVTNTSSPTLATITTTGNIELGHASDTTISRVSAGVAAVEGKNIALNGTGETLTTGTIELGAASDTTIARSGAGAITVEGVQVLLSGAALGTPASGTLTNCTGLPVAGITASTVTALGVGSLELGHASDTTLSRSAAGVLAVEGVNVLTVAGGTLTGSITLGENTAIALDPAGSADGKYTGTTITAIAGYAQSFGDLVYLDPTDSRWEKTDANAGSGADGDARGILGMVVVAGAADGTACTILLNGVIRADAAFPAMTINAPMYVSETAGAITGTIPTTTDAVMRCVGFAITADELRFDPSTDYATHT